MFDWSPTSSNTCDWIMHFGTGIINTPADSSVTEAKLGSVAVTQAKIGNEAVNEAKMQISNAGTNGQFLSKQSGDTGGLTWADAGGGGKLLQIVANETTSSISTTNYTTPQATGFTTAITPSATSSKILIMLSGGRRDQTDGDCRMGLYLYYDVGGAGYNSVTGGVDKIVTTSDNTADHSVNWLLSPNTTSAVTIQPYFLRDHASGTETIYFNNSGGRTQMHLLEIGA